MAYSLKHINELAKNDPKAFVEGTEAEFQRKLELAAKQEVLEQAFQLALDDLCALPAEQYQQLLVALLKKASTTGREQVIFSPKDRQALGRQTVDTANAAMSAHLTLSEQTRPIRGGFILADGDVELNCAFETLVRLQREKLEKAAVQLSLIHISEPTRRTD